MPDFLGFQYRVILNLYRILFHAVVIFGPQHTVRYHVGNFIYYSPHMFILKWSEIDTQEIKMYNFVNHKLLLIN